MGESCSVLFVSSFDVLYAIGRHFMLLVNYWTTNVKRLRLSVPCWLYI
jgi:hypothetical protein